MFARSIETALTELADAPDIEVAQIGLDRSSAALLQIPEDGAALVRALGGAEQGHERVDDLLEILSAALDGARMTQEKGQARGGVLIAALEDAVAQLARDGLLTVYGSLSLSRAWLRAGLVPPMQLGLSEGIPDDLELGSLDSSQAEAMLDELFGDLIEQAEGDVTAIHGALTEMLPSLHAEVRASLIISALARPDEMFGRLGCAFLLDPAKDTRLAAALGLAARLAAGHLEAEVAAQLVILRSWLPAPPEPSLQRFIDLLVLRYSETLIKLVDPKDLVHTFKNMDGAGQRGWCEGFLDGLKSFKKSWPAKSLGPNDRTMLRQIEIMADDPAAETSAIPALATWLSGRMGGVNG